MGYENVTHYKLKFEERPGLEVTVEELAIGELLDVVALADKIPDKGAARGVGPEAEKALRSLMETLAEHLIEWNVERRGEPLPADLPGVLRCSAALVMDIIGAWVKAQNEPDDDLGKGSGSGGTSALERSLPMEPRSPSRLS